MRQSAVLFGMEEVRAEWLHDLRHPIVDRRYDVSQRLMAGESLQRLRAMSRAELDAYLGQEQERDDKSGDWRCWDCGSTDMNHKCPRQEHGT